MRGIAVAGDPLRHQGGQSDAASEMAAPRRNRATPEYECPLTGGRQRRGGELFMVIVITKVEEIEATAIHQRDTDLA